LRPEENPTSKETATTYGVELRDPAGTYLLRGKEPSLTDTASTQYGEVMRIDDKAVSLQDHGSELCENFIRSLDCGAAVFTDQMSVDLGGEMVGRRAMAEMRM
jgi:hypothetical protein